MWLDRLAIPGSLDLADNGIDSHKDCGQIYQRSKSDWDPVKNVVDERPDFQPVKL